MIATLLIIIAVVFGFLYANWVSTVRRPLFRWALGIILTPILMYVLTVVGILAWAKMQPVGGYHSQIVGLHSSAGWFFLLGATVGWVVNVFKRYKRQRNPASSTEAESL